MKRGLKVMKRVLSTVLIMALCITLLFTGCEKKVEYTAEGHDKLNETIVATIEGVNVTQADYNLLYKMAYEQSAQYAQYYGEGWIDTVVDEEKGTTIADSIKENALAYITHRIAATIMAEELEVGSSDKVKENVENNKKQIVENNGGKEGYINFLNSYRTTDKAVETYLEREKIYDNLVKRMSREDGSAYIEDEELIEEFSKDYTCVKHILISTQPQQGEDGKEIPARSEADAEKLVAEILAKIEKGEDFDELIDKYDEDPGMEKGGFYTFPAGQMVPEFEEASKNLKVGEYTKEAVKTDYGYHIIKRYDIDTKNEEYVSFKQGKMNEKIGETIQKKVETLKIDKKEKEVSKYVDAWLEELKKETQEMIKAQQEAQAQQQAAPEQAEGTEVPAEEATAEDAENAPAEGAAEKAE